MRTLLLALNQNFVPVIKPGCPTAASSRPARIRSLQWSSASACRSIIPLPWFCKPEQRSSDATKRERQILKIFRHFGKRILIFERSFPASDKFSFLQVDTITLS